jgi:D-alanyl-D-alanine carboxypeptidase
MSQDVWARNLFVFSSSLTAQYIAHTFGTMLHTRPCDPRITFRFLLLFFAVTVLAGTPKLAGKDPTPQLDASIGAYARDHDFSGTILVQQSGKRLYHKSFGLADRAFSVPADNKTRYRVASITKLFTSTLILQLYQEGKIDLTAPVRTYLPDYPGEGGDGVTVHHLLNHTSGIAQWDNVPSYQEAFANGVERYQKPIAADARLQLCCSGKLAHPPGTKFDYNNADYFVLGAIIERMSGKTFEEVVAERILRPVGMRHTGMLHWDAIVERLAPTYFYRDDRKTLVSDMPVYYENWYAAAGMYSTPDDLLAFADALYGGKLLRPETLRQLLTPGLDDYGYGVWSYVIKRGGKQFRVAKRPGSNMGANAILYRLLDCDATVVIVANTNKADLDVFAQRIGDILLQ